MSEISKEMKDDDDMRSVANEADDPKTSEKVEDNADIAEEETDEEEYMPQHGAPLRLYGPTAKKIFHREYHERRYGLYYMPDMATPGMVALVVLVEVCILAHLVAFYFVVGDLNKMSIGSRRIDPESVDQIAAHAEYYVWVFAALVPNFCILRTVLEMMNLYNPHVFELMLNAVAVVLWSIAYNQGLKLDECGTIADHARPNSFIESFRSKNHHGLDAREKGREITLLHNSIGLSVHILFVLQLVVTIFQSLYCLSFVFKIRVLGYLVRIALKIMDSDFFYLLPATLELLAVGSGYYAYLVYGLISCSTSPTDDAPSAFYDRRILFAVLFHVLATFALICLNYHRHMIKYHQHFINRKIFKEKFLRFLEVYDPDLDVIEREAAKRRYGLSVTPKTLWPEMFNIN